MALVLPDATSLTLYMCWHGGTGHDYPADVMQAAGRLRERYAVGSGSDEGYTSLTFVPSDDNVPDVTRVAPYCDLAYATNADGEVVLDVSGGEGACGSLQVRPTMKEQDSE
jgi:hypothetical protein